jgi:hypothetical protein
MLKGSISALEEPAEIAVDTVTWLFPVVDEDAVITDSRYVSTRHA